MKTNAYLLEEDTFYHLYNRGIDSGKLFFKEKNYIYFLQLLNNKTESVCDMLSYCLLPNHFHLLIKTKKENEIRENFPQKENILLAKIISQQFSNVFNSYTQAINKAIGRTGKLFELPFRRKIITKESQLMNTILYIHCNPARHGITSNIKSFTFSSFHEIINEKSDFLKSDEVLNLFDGKENFENAINDYMKKYM